MVKVNEQALVAFNFDYNNVLAWREEAGCSAWLQFLVLPGGPVLVGKLSHSAHDGAPPPRWAATLPQLRFLIQGCSAPDQAMVALHWISRYECRVSIVRLGKVPCGAFTMSRDTPLSSCSSEKYGCCHVPQPSMWWASGPGRTPRSPPTPPWTTLWGSRLRPAWPRLLWSCWATSSAWP